MKDRTTLWVIVFWIGMLIILVWFFLKAIGVINTPVYIEYLPVLGIVFGIGAFFQTFIDFKLRLAKLEKRVDNIGNGLQRLEYKFDEHIKDYNLHIKNHKS